LGGGLGEYNTPIHLYKREYQKLETLQVNQLETRKRVSKRAGEKGDLEGISSGKEETRMKRG